MPSFASQLHEQRELFHWLQRSGLAEAQTFAAVIPLGLRRWTAWRLQVIFVIDRAYLALTKISEKCSVFQIP